MRNWNFYERKTEKTITGITMPEAIGLLRPYWDIYEDDDLESFLNEAIAQGANGISIGAINNNGGEIWFDVE